MAKSNIEKQIDGLNEEMRSLEERIDRLTESKAKEIEGLQALVNEKSATVEVLETQIDALEHGEETEPEKVKEILAERLEVEKDLQTAKKELEIVSDKLKKATDSKEYLTDREYSEIRQQIGSYLKQSRELFKELCLPDLADIRRAGEALVTATQRANMAEKKAVKLSPKVDKTFGVSRYDFFYQAKPYIDTTRSFDVFGQWWTELS